MIIMPMSYESVRAELDQIIEQDLAHITRDGNKAGLTRQEAVERIRRLGFSRGDAVRWLDPKPQRRRSAS
jgi:hypothetical protein